MSSTEFTETLRDTTLDVDEAHRTVGALVELLSGCPLEYPLQAGLFLGLIRPLHLSLENAAGGVRALSRQGVSA